MHAINVNDFELAYISNEVFVITGKAIASISTLLFNGLYTAVLSAL